MPTHQIEALLGRLDRVKKTGAANWSARCPAHEDRCPSLSVKELDNGRILVHCFAGCGVDAVLAAVGLELSDLFPSSQGRHSTKPQRRPFPATDILRAIAFEALVVLTAGCALLTGESFSDADRERLVLAVARIGNAFDAGGLRHG